MFCTVEEILVEIRNRRPFLLVDSADREDEADLIMPAEFADRKLVNFMITYCRGVVCVAITKELACRLELDLLKRRNTSNTAYFTTSIEAKGSGVTTGISAADRALTMKLLTKDNVAADDFITPGHIFPLIVNENGLAARQGHTEGGATLVKLAGLKPIAVICEVLNEDGDSAKRLFLESFSAKHNIKITNMEMLLSYLKDNDTNITF